MGCRFGVAFAEAGAQVWLYDVWQEHVNQMNANGLVVEDGVGGERTLEVNKQDACIRCGGHFYKIHVYHGRNYESCSHNRQGYSSTDPSEWPG